MASMAQQTVANVSNSGSRFVAKAAPIKLEKAAPQHFQFGNVLLPNQLPKINGMRTRGTGLALLQPHAIISHPQKPKLCVYQPVYQN